MHLVNGADLGTFNIDIEFHPRKHSVIPEPSRIIDASLYKKVALQTSLYQSYQNRGRIGHIVSLSMASIRSC
jgi:hypothetical protein